MKKPPPKSIEPFVREVRLARDRVVSFDEYPFSIPVVRKLDRLKLHPKVTFLVGENGAGKSTLLEAIAVAWGFNPEGGSRNFNFSTRGSHSQLSEYLTLVKAPRQAKDGYFLRAESFFTVATEIERLDEGSGMIMSAYGSKSLHEQSHGESFLALFLNRFHDNGLYVLDEPETALSPQRQFAFLSRLHQMVGGNSQFIIATHSPIILAYPNAVIYECSGSGFAKKEYTETEHYQLTRRFLEDHESMLKILLDGNY